MTSGKSRRWPSYRLLSSLRGPAITIGLLLVPFSVYYLHVRDQREFLISRSFRILATMSDQIRATVNNFQDVIDNACKEVKRKDERFKFGENLRQARLQGEQTACVDEKRAFYMSLRFEGGDGDVWLHLDKNGGKAPPDSAPKARLKELVQPFLPPEDEALFEDIVVADQYEGHVLYQRSRSGLRFTDVKEFLAGSRTEAKQEEGKTEGTSKPAKDGANETIHIPSKLIQTSLSGTDYVVFVQPIQLALLRTPNESRREDDYAEWLICGFVRSDRLFSESLLISYSVIEVLAGALLLAFLAWPFLKLRFMTPRERLRPADVVFMAISLLMAAAVTTIFLLNSYFSWGLEQDTDDRLIEVAKKIKADLYTELYRLSAQLEHFNASVRVPGTDTERIEINRPGRMYPQYNMVFWMGKDGWQNVKWTASGNYTPRFNVSERPFFHDFTDPRKPHWQLTLLPGGPFATSSKSLDFLFYSSFSPNTGINQAVFVMRAFPEGDPREQAKLLYIGSANLPQSLFHLVLPPGFGYSLVNVNGWAEYHSRDERNQRENLFVETYNDSSVRAAVLSTAQGGAGVMAEANYLGREHSLYFSPTQIRNMPLSLVTFRDRMVTRTVSLEILTIALGLVSVYLLGLGFALLAIRWMWNSRLNPLRESLWRWVWPSQERAAAYDAVALVQGLMILAFAGWLWSNRSLPGSLTAGAVLLASITAAVTAFLCCSGLLSEWTVKLSATLRKPDSSAEAPNVSPDVRWRRPYTRAALGLIATLGIMPAVLFWQAARYFESSLFVNWGQQKLAEAYQQRPGGSIKPGGSVKPSKSTQPDGPIEPGGREWKEIEPPGFHAATFYGTAIEKLTKAEFRDPTSFSDCILSKFIGPYNQTALEIGAMAGECRESVPGLWTWQRPPGGPFKLLGPDLAVSTSQLLWLRWPKVASDWLALAATLGAAGALLWTLWRIVSSLVTRIFFLERAPQPKETSRPAIPDKDTPYLLVLRPVSSFEHDWPDPREVTPVSLATMTDASQALSAIRADSECKPVAITHFEHRLEDKEFTDQKLKILEQLVLTGERRVLIVSSVDPLYALASAGGGLDQSKLQRWAAVMKPFKECRFAAIGGSQTERDYLVEWTLCTTAEKLMLLQLAQGSLVNPNGEAVLRQLLWKGLVDEKHYRIKDEAFRVFVLSQPRPEDVRRWEREGGPGWGALQGGFVTLLVGTGFILFVAQRDILHTWIPYVTGVAGWLASMSKTFEGLRGKG